MLLVLCVFVSSNQASSRPLGTVKRVTRPVEISRSSSGTLLLIESRRKSHWSEAQQHNRYHSETRKQVDWLLSHSFLPIGPMNVLDYHSHLQRFLPRLWSPTDQPDRCLLFFIAMIIHIPHTSSTNGWTCTYSLRPSMVWVCRKMNLFEKNNHCRGPHMH